ncbi:DUF262 domain-containing HNH endonuclease family protein [uncultured Shewanella sp.]|uniref:DUF262 domain-containing protein n=1 Tax=uncultured Shewanella sp. TaxID=173975 RepID=UPI0026344647|nr:DUF262 domain-containing HNH endonuclease family protein [uncultured Shewanella sp.]
MVVYQTRKPYFGIVDGQQRLTTITLILSAIRNAFITLGENNLAKGVHKYVEKANIDNEDEFVLNSETSFPYLQDHIQSFNGLNVSCDVGVEEKKLESAFTIIEKNLERYIPELSDVHSEQGNLFTDHDNLAVQKLKNIRDKVLSLKLVFIQLDNEDDAYLIFETLNARGRDLTTSDLVKNLMLKRIKNTSVSIDQAKESWNGMVRHFDDVADPSSLDAFLLHFWVSKYKYTTDKKLFSEVKAFIGNSAESAKELMSDLNIYSKLYCTLLSPSQRDWSKEEVLVKKSLISLNIFKVKQQTALTLALLHKYDKKLLSLRNLRKTLEKIELFHYCFNAITSQRSSGAIASNYSRLAIKLTEASENGQIQSVLNELDTFLRSKMPDLNEFRVKFSELGYGNKKSKDKNIVRYSLEFLLPKNNGCLSVDNQHLTIEHFLSQSTDLSSCDVSDDEIYNIGNLLLLDNTTNSIELADKPPRDKFEILRKKNYPMEESLLLPQNWNKDSIKKRADIMAQEIYKKCRKIV